jgi:hypothetical protein
MTNLDMWNTKIHAILVGFIFIYRSPKIIHK